MCYLPLEPNAHIWKNCAHLSNITLFTIKTCSHATRHILNMAMPPTSHLIHAHICWRHNNSNSLSTVIRLWMCSSGLPTARQMHSHNRYVNFWNIQMHCWKLKDSTVPAKMESETLIDLLMFDSTDLVRRDSAVPNMFRKGLVRGLWPQNCLELGK